MSYSPVTFTSGQQPTTPQWNQLGTNDASFNDGTGIGQVIGPAHLTSGAITLGYAQISSVFSTTSTTDTQVTGLSVSVTIPSGSRRIEITFFSPSNLTSGAGYCIPTIYDGAPGSGTKLQEFYYQTAAGSVQQGISMTAIVQPAAGAKTYNIGLRQAGSVTAYINSTSANAPAFIIVKAI